MARFLCTNLHFRFEVILIGTTYIEVASKHKYVHLIHTMQSKSCRNFTAVQFRQTSFIVLVPEVCRMSEGPELAEESRQTCRRDRDVEERWRRRGNRTQATTPKRRNQRH